MKFSRADSKLIKEVAVHDFGVNSNIPIDTYLITSDRPPPEIRRTRRSKKRVYVLRLRADYSSIKTSKRGPRNSDHPTVLRL